ncbi:hypothetical protein RU639_000791 [Aspergillus parasiticus]
MRCPTRDRLTPPKSGATKKHNPTHGGVPSNNNLARFYLLECYRYQSKCLTLLALPVPLPFLVRARLVSLVERLALFKGLFWVL